MNKLRVDCWLTPTTYMKLLTFQSKNGHKNLSRAANVIFELFFGQQSIEDQQDNAVNKLNKVIQDKEKKIRELEFKERTQGKVIKE